jgi:dynein heavy chain
MCCSSLDTRYMFGEIMYGGHITDFWDRRTCNTYLEVLLRPELFSGMELGPNFKSPDANSEFIFYKNYIEHSLPNKETPQMFGLHSNAEIGFMNTEGETLFSTILDLKGASGGGSASAKEAAVLKTVDEILTTLPAEFSLLEINERIEEKTPMVVIILQECDRMNTLLGEISRSLNECKLGLTGALNISEAMEGVTDALFLNRVPGSWASVGYPSLKALGAWIENLKQRALQLQSWSRALSPTDSCWLPGLFNPMAFLTAVTQTTARLHNYPLDSMGILTTVTNLYPHQVVSKPENGVYIHGLYLEGCRWDDEEQQLTQSKLKELFVELPVVHVTAVKVELLPTKGLYLCPVYVTAQRGPTYVFTARLPTDADPSVWVLAGVACLLSLST